MSVSSSEYDTSKEIPRVSFVLQCNAAIVEFRDGAEVE
jgi:hypothetical protein